MGPLCSLATQTKKTGVQSSQKEMFLVLKAEQSFLAEYGLNQHAAPVGREYRGDLGLCKMSRTYMEDIWQEEAYGKHFRKY